jgi:hypothetical protein
MNRVVHFEIAADDPERAAAFYTNALGWNIEKWDGEFPYWMATTGQNGPGIDGGIMQRQGAAPTGEPMAQGNILAVGVESIDETGEKITQAGGQNVMPKMAVSDMGWVAYWKDTEGNTFGTWQNNGQNAG